MGAEPLIKETTGMDLFDVVEAGLVNQRRIHLIDDIEEHVAAKVARFLDAMSLQSSDEITMLISSAGGSLDAGQAIISAIRNAVGRGVTVTGEVRGYAMSMAAIILQNCTSRFAGADDVIMIHGATSMSGVGDVRNQEADLKQVKRYMDLQAKNLADRNTSDHKKYHDTHYWRDILDDRFPVYLFGDEAYEQGLIDEVI